jgi:tetratricopeptide (TPR) repeat protein
MSELHGRLEDEPLPTVLQELYKTKATGTLKLEARVGKHEIYVREGYPVSVNLPGSAELLGKVLVEMGILDEETHKRTLAQPPPQGMKYGEWLVEKQLVTAEHMKLALKAQVRRKLHRLFFLNEGNFDFRVGEHQQGMERSESLKIHPARAIYQGVRSAWNAERLKGALFLLEGQAMKCVLDGAGVARYGLGQEDGKVAEMLCKGYWTVADLAQACGLPVQPLHALIYSLYVTEALDLRDAATVPLLRKKSETPLGTQPQPNAPSQPIATSPSKPSPIAPAPAPAFGTPTAQMASVAQSKPTTGSNPMIRPSDLSGPRKIPTEPSGAFKLPSGLNLNDPEQMRKAIELKAKVVDAQDLYSVLDLQPSAGKEQVKQAYFDAAKRFHPDRLTSLGLESLRGEVEKIFRRVSEAYGTLYDDARREEYRKTLGQGGKKDENEAHAKAMKMLEAEMAFKRGEILMRKADWPNAIRELEQSVTLNPEEGEHLAHLAWARVNAGQMTFAEAKARFNEATKLSPRNGKSFYFLGLAYKDEGDVDRALAAMRKALELDTRLIEAEREIRLIMMRKEKGGGAKSGLFDRFRKK